MPRFFLTTVGLYWMKELIPLQGAQSWSNPAGCTADDWLITPAIDLSAATGSVVLGPGELNLLRVVLLVFQRVMKFYYLLLERMHQQTSLLYLVLLRKKISGQAVLLI